MNDRYQKDERVDLIVDSRMQQAVDVVAVYLRLIKLFKFNLIKV